MRKCKGCIEHPHDQVGFIGNPAAVQGSLQIQLQGVVPIHIYQEEMSKVLAENVALKREKEELLAKALELALPVEIKKKVAGFEDEISRLRKENDALRSEYVDLRRQIDALEKSSDSQQKEIEWQQEQINALIGSMRKENKIALRALFDQAKKMNLSLDQKIIDYMKKSSQGVHGVNSAAHEVPKEVIKRAVFSVPRHNKAIVLALYYKVYPEKSDEEESDIDDFYD